MDNKSLLNKNNLREDDFSLFFLCFDFISTIEKSLEENYHSSCGNWLPVLKNMDVLYKVSQIYHNI